MARVIATINLKGGVGKTQTTVALAEVLSAEFRKKVLVIDLDPQTNATTLLIGEKRWAKLNEQRCTLAQLFKDALEEDSQQHRFDLSGTLQRRASPVEEVAWRLDLLPSSLDLIDVQEKLSSMPAGRFHSNVPTDVLRRAVKPVIDDYDYVLIDCPPNLGIVTLNGLRIANGYVIPVIPDYLSTYGIPQIQNRVAQFAENIAENILPYGIVVSKYRSQVTAHRNIVAQLRAGKMANSIPVFDTVIPEAGAISAAGEFKKFSTLRQKYGYGNTKAVDLYASLAGEIIKAVEG